MNRRQKIIVSVTGIFIVLLILIGLTYAYFLTRITGNGNPTSISVTTANLELVYGDGTTAILTSETPLMPSSTPIGTKDFTVTNNGDDSEYVVVFEDITVKYAADTVIDGETVTAGTDTTFESNDFVYTLTCTKKDGSTCEGVEEEIFPMDGGIVVGNSIDKGDVHTYQLTLYYKDSGLDQSTDMNKALNGKVNIKDIKSINPYSENKQSLAYNIINNSMLNKNGTQLVAKPPSKVAEETSLNNWEDGIEESVYLNSEHLVGYAETEDEFWRCYEGYEDESTGEWLQDCSAIKEYTSCTDDVKGKYVFDEDNWETTYVNECEDGKIVINTIKYEKVLSTSVDDLGTSYYYRGNVNDNYVNFAGMCWRIVRIAGDGSIKIILEDKNTTCDNTSFTGDWEIGVGNYGYEEKNVDSDSGSEYIMSYLNPVKNANKSMVKSFYDFQTTGKLKDYTNKLKSGDWCFGDKAYKYVGEYPDFTYSLLEDYDYSLIDYELAVSMHYDSYVRLYGANKDGYNPTLKCTGTTINNFLNVTIGDTTITTESPMYVSTLTADEMVYAGGKVYEYNEDFYLMNESFYNEDDLNHFFSLSPSRFVDSWNDTILVLDSLVQISEGNVDFGSFRPAINLKSGSVITDGDGTQMNPYVVE